MKKPKSMKAEKGKAPKMMSQTKSSPSFGDRMKNNPSKTRDVRTLVGQKNGADGTAIKNEKKQTRSNLKKKLEGMKF